MAQDHKLLIIDDEVEICELLKEVGELSDYSVTTITNPTNFIAVFIEVDPAVIILDLSIPDHDGIEILRDLAKHNCSAPIILESGQDTKVLETSVKIGSELGLNMSGYFQKPLNLKEVGETLLRLKESPERLSLDFLKEAIRTKRIVMHYQPQVSFKTKKVVGVESLVRINSNGRIVFPDTFIPLAEESNLISPLSQLIIKRAFAEYKEFLKLVPELCLSVNLSPKSLKDLVLPDELHQLSKEAKIDSEKVCIEITETAFMDHKSIIADIITRFRLKGFKLSIDDFGTGFASFSELYQLPFNELKIDKSFTKELRENSEASKIVNSIIALAHSLGLTVVAEGVETQSTWDILEKAGCDVAQGYLLSHPLHADEIKTWLKENKDGFKVP